MKDLLLEKYNLIKEDIENIKKEYSIDYDVNIVAVTKYASDEAIANFLSLGFNVPCAESRGQVLRDKYKRYNYDNWHFIGRIQKNKIKYIVEYSKLIQSVDSLETAFLINEYARKIEKKQDILLQFNISNEEHKAGLSVRNYQKDCEGVLKLSNIHVLGVMGMASFTSDEYLVNNEFESLYKVYSSMKANYSIDNFDVVSMGMSSDYKIAIKHNANMIRIGSNIFNS